MNKEFSQLGEIISVKPIQCDDEFVYNLEVESQDASNKNYFADGVLVSNCHRMSAAAEEALLKLLEEPPAKVRFILCTTELQQMRGTIHSRCQVHEFKTIYWREISRHLENIAKLEKINIEPEAIHLCSKLADGSMRNGLQNLEKLVGFAGDKSLTLELAQEAFGTVSDMVFYDLIDEMEVPQGDEIYNDSILENIFPVLDSYLTLKLFEQKK